MNENINLCEILKGHKGETFYSPVFGELTLTDFIGQTIRFERKDGIDIILLHNGKWCKDSEEISVFPSKDQRDWNKWVEENNPKVPKTWSDLERIDSIKECSAEIIRTFNNRWFDNTKCNTPIEKSALALLKIHQLIEVGYGGNVDRKYIDKSIYHDYPYYGIGYNHIINKFYICEIKSKQVALILFRDEIYAEEFLKYPENVQLLKDYFII